MTTVTLVTQDGEPVHEYEQTFEKEEDWPVQIAWDGRAFNFRYGPSDGNDTLVYIEAPA